MAVDRSGFSVQARGYKRRGIERRTRNQVQASSLTATQLNLDRAPCYSRPHIPLPRMDDADSAHEVVALADGGRAIPHEKHVDDVDSG
ncbi:MAG: hypothetical protein M1826_003463 [Phylliscum demangeonii]|nr:MAG: hypothetical protein M1826_003463 [Phylliscum demangeonii]